MSAVRLGRVAMRMCCIAWVKAQVGTGWSGWCGHEGVLDGVVWAGGRTGWKDWTPMLARVTPACAPTLTLARQSVATRSTPPAYTQYIHVSAQCDSTIALDTHRLHVPHRGMRSTPVSRPTMSSAWCVLSPTGISSPTKVCGVCSAPQPQICHKGVWCERSSPARCV